MAASSRLLCGLFIGILSLSACGGGGGGTSAAAPAVVPQAKQRAATLTVFVPNASSSGSSTRRRDLPSSTQSVEVVVASASGAALNPPVAPIIQNISATSAGCSAVSGGISCVINASVPFGSLLFAVVAYTGQNATGNPIAWGYTVATIGASGSNAVSITTSSVIVYFTMNLDGNITLATIDHNANTLAAANTSSGTSTNGAITYLPNGDVKIVVSASTDPNTPVGTVFYARELPGVALTFFSTGTSTPPANAEITSGADWGVGTELTACPTAAASYEVSVAAVEGPGYQLGSNLTTGAAFQNGTAAIAVSGTTNLNFDGTSYTINGTAGQSQMGMAGPCSGGIFAATTGSSSSGELAFDTQGVIVGASSGAGGTSTSLNNGEMGFTVQSGSTIDLSALTSGTYDGFIGGYNVLSPSDIEKEGSAAQLVPGGSNTLLSCNYSAFEAGTVDSSSCATVTFGAQPFPGIVLATFTQGSSSVSAVFSIAQLSGKYVLFGVLGSTNMAFIEH
jgi:hypothetical protein